MFWWFQHYYPPKAFLLQVVGSSLAHNTPFIPHLKVGPLNKPTHLVLPDVKLIVFQGDSLDEGPSCYKVTGAYCFSGLSSLTLNKIR